MMNAHVHADGSICCDNVKDELTLSEHTWIVATLQYSDEANICQRIIKNYE